MMTQDEETVLTILAKVGKREKSAIKPDDDLVADLGLDSPRQLQVLTDIEDQLQIEIDEDDAARIVKVKDIFAYVAAKKK